MPAKPLKVEFGTVPVSELTEMHSILNSVYPWFDITPFNDLTCIFFTPFNNLTKALPVSDSFPPHVEEQPWRVSKSPAVPETAPVP